MARRADLAPVPEDLAAEREVACRLTPDRFLQDLDEARDLLRDRGMLTNLPCCALPSLFGACASTAKQGARGFERWPSDKWWWEGALAEADGVVPTKVLKGKRLLVDERLVPVFDGPCRAALVDADDGRLGPDAQALVRQLDAAGPLTLEAVRTALALDSGAARRAREPLERLGAVVSRSIQLDAANGGHRHTSLLARWDQICGSTHGGPVDAVVEAGVRAAVVAPEGEVRSWFAWPAVADAIDRLVADGRLRRPASGWLAAASRAEG